MRASRASSKAAAKDIHSDTKKTTTYLHAAKQFPFKTIVAAVCFVEPVVYGDGGTATLRQAVYSSGNSPGAGNFP